MSEDQDRFTPSRLLPVRPNLDQLKHQAKDLLRAIRGGDSDAIEEFKKYHPQASRLALNADETSALATNADKMFGNLTQDARGPIKLADAQLVLARSYGAPSWPRLVQAWHLIDSICRADV